MICPNCMNEKYQDPTCPQCGLGEKDALLKAAERYRSQEKQGLVLQSYERYLALEPGDREVARKRISLSASMAMEQRDPALYQKAEASLAQFLEGQWDWQAGHELRLSLAIAFGKLGALRETYQRMKEKDPAKAAVCDRMVKMIQLSEKFQGERPAVPESLEDVDLPAQLGRNSLVLLGSAVLLTLLKIFLVPAEYSHLASWPAVAVLSLFIYVVWVVIKIWRSQTRRKRTAPVPELKL